MFSRRVEDMMGTLNGRDLLKQLQCQSSVNKSTIQMFLCSLLCARFYNCTRVLCECHSKTSDREPT